MQVRNSFNDTNKIHLYLQMNVVCELFALYHHIHATVNLTGPMTIY